MLRFMAALVGALFARWVYNAYQRGDMPIFRDRREINERMADRRFDSAERWS